MVNYLQGSRSDIQHVRNDKYARVTIGLINSTQNMRHATVAVCTAEFSEISSPRNTTWKQFVRATRPTFLRVIVLKTILLNQSTSLCSSSLEWNSTGQTFWPKKCKPYRGMTHMSATAQILYQRNRQFRNCPSDGTLPYLPHISVLLSGSQ